MGRNFISLKGVVNFIDAMAKKCETVTYHFVNVESTQITSEATNIIMASIFICN